MLALEGQPQLVKSIAGWQSGSLIQFLIEIGIKKEKQGEYHVVEKEFRLVNTRLISLLLWIVNLCAICASTLSYVYLSYYSYKSTGSIIFSQIVLFSPMVLPVIFVAQIQRLADRVGARTLLMLSNFLSLATALIVYGLLEHVPLIAVAGGVLIGALDAVQRVARIVAIKRYFSIQDVKFTGPLTLTAQFIAGGLAGGAIGLIRGEMTPFVALALTCALFSGAAVAATLLPSVSHLSTSAQRVRGIWPTFRGLLQTNPDLRRSFWVFIVFVSIYQGFFNVSRVTLPAHVLQLAERYVGLLQVVNSAAALIGALLYHVLGKRGVCFPPLAMTLVSAVFMVSASWGITAASSYVAYFLYIFFFELAFFKLQSDVVINSPPKEMALVASVQYAMVYAGMICTIFIGSLLVEGIGLMWTSIIFVVLYITVIILHPNAFRPTGRAVIEHQ
ncbi:MAG: hypothetical protein K1X48_10435 [Burkholderiaceae bacterium]|nr:hypothetical protein [Burkholderiaceae bacterium]